MCPNHLNLPAIPHHINSTLNFLSSIDILHTHLIIICWSLQTKKNLSLHYSRSSPILYCLPCTLLENQYINILYSLSIRSQTVFKLKNIVPVSNLWLTSSMESFQDAGDVSHTSDRSIIIGWPMVNTLTTFQSCEQKMMWSKLLER